MIDALSLFFSILIIYLLFIPSFSASITTLFLFLISMIPVPETLTLSSFELAKIYISSTSSSILSMYLPSSLFKSYPTTLNSSSFIVPL